ncbi:MAG: alkaline phosphatase D family protein [Capsulimonadales bacterium]|nr:alkaline phosphatase D family protein [Capsulimonadales bacterium]
MSADTVLPPFGPLTRRQLLKRSASGLLLAATSAVPLPSIAQGGRPVLTHGIQSGDITETSAILWSRSDRPARMVVEVAATEQFRDARRLLGPVALENTDFTAKLRVTDLPAGQEVFYRVSFVGLDSDRATSEPQIGRLRTAPAPNGKPNRAVSFVWTGDTAGQGWGINEEWGGMRGYETMLRNRPDFLINSGDCVYSDGVIPAEVKLADGTLWKNRTTEAKSKVAETLEEFRGNFRYNLLDTHYRKMMAETPMLVQWDDHETTNNWYPEEILEDSRYTVKSVPLLSARANQAFREYMPIREFDDEPGRVYRKISYGPLLDIFVIDMRTYRGNNTANRQERPGPDTAFLGAAQMAWLKRELESSRATWKVFAADMPIGLIVPDGNAMEAIANGDGPPLGREFEIADLLRFLKQRDIRNTLWLTADVHYTAAHHYDPARAQFKEFLPFWEFVSGPIHAGTFGPNRIDPTFGPEVRFIKDGGGKSNLPPSDGLQFFGHVRIAPDTRVLTVTLKDIADRSLYTVDLTPQRR